MCASKVQNVKLARYQSQHYDAGEGGGAKTKTKALVHATAPLSGTAHTEISRYSGQTFRYLKPGIQKIDAGTRVHLFQAPNQYSYFLL